MAETTFDQSPCGEQILGSFRRGPVHFTVVRTRANPADVSDYGPGSGCGSLAGPSMIFRVDCDDGVGPREVCRFTDDPRSPPIWRGAWNGDEWCAWIMGEARKAIANANAPGTGTGR